MERWTLVQKKKTSKIFFINDNNTITHTQSMTQSLIHKAWHSHPYTKHDTIIHTQRSIGSYPNLRVVQSNPLPERAALGQGMTAVHPADEGLEPRSPMHLRTKTKNGSYMIWPGTGLSHAPELWTPLSCAAELIGRFFKEKNLATSNEKVGMYREKSALEELLSRASAADDSWEHSSDLTSSSQFLLTRSSTYFFESNLASSWAPLRSSHWKLDLDLHPRQIKVDMLFLWSHTPRSSFFVDSSTSFCQHILVSQKDNRDIFRGGTSKESSK